MKKNTLVVLSACSLTLLLGCSRSNSFLDIHDHNADGQITREEYDRTFDSIDQNGNGLLENEEVGNVLSGH